MSSIPLLRFPLLVQKEILDHLDPIDLIRLSLFSWRFKKTVSSFKITVDSFTFSIENSAFEIEITSWNDTFISVKRGKADGGLFWKLDSENKLEYDEPDTCQLRIRKSDFERVARDLLSFIRVPKKVDLKLHSPLDMGLFLFHMIPSFNSIIVTPTRPRNGFYFEDVDLEYMLSYVNVNHLSINVDIEGPDTKYRHKGPTKPKKVTFYFTETLDMNYILLIDPKIFFLAVPGHKVEMVVQKWMKGDNQELENLIISIKTPMENAEFLSRIGRKTRFSNQEIQRRKPHAEKDILEVWDIRRRRDNRLATVLRTEQTIDLLVWN